MPCAVQWPDVDYGNSWLIAWDPITQKERWAVLGRGGGGSLATAGNLVFQVAGPGYLRAFSADKGEKLLEVPVPSTPPDIPGPPITFMVSGKQYVSAAQTSGRGASRIARLYPFILDGKTPLP